VLTSPPQQSVGWGSRVKFLQVYAVVDKDYHLLWVGGEWDEFAMQNAGKSTANSVLSTSLLAYIAGEETRTLTARLIDTVVSLKRPLRLEYRCDSPSMARKFMLTIQPMKDDRALLVHDLRDAWHFSPPLKPWHFDADAPDCKCSMCGNVRLQGTSVWETCDELRDRHPTRVTYDICPTCLAAAEAAMRDVHLTEASPFDADTGQVKI
jgi:hypothetical protein